MAPASFEMVGFDLDGTLVDTSGDLAAAVNHALGEAGRAPLPVDAVRPMIGGGARLMLARALRATGGCDDRALDVLFPRLLDYYEDHIAVHSHPYPGAVAAIDELAGRGAALGIMTNKLERLSVKLLDALGLADRFTASIGGDTLGIGKPSPEPIRELVRRCGGGRAAFVGDSRYDVEAARAAGLPAVVVSFGFSREPVASLGAAAVIDRFDQLVPALERIAAR